MFGLGKGKPLRDEYRLVVEEISKGKPITPKHSQPPRVDHQGFTSCISEHDRALFAKTTTLGDMLNRHLSWGAWRVQEKPRNDIPWYDDPLFGRRFDLFFNAHLAGEVCLFAKPMIWPNDPLEVHIGAEVEFAQFYPFGDIRSLLLALAALVLNDGETDFAAKSQEVDLCLTGTLWEIVRLPDVIHTLSYRASGTAHHFLMRGTAQQPSIGADAT
jgi:hypothetical protein